MKKIICGVIVFFVFFISILALTQPPSTVEVYEPCRNDFVKSLNLKENIKFANNAEIDGNGFVRVSGGDSYIVFDRFEEKFRTVVVNFKKPLENPITAQLFFRNEKDFSEEMSVIAFGGRGAEYICFSLPYSELPYTSVRIDIDSNYTFKNIELRSEQPHLVPLKINRTLNYYLLIIVIPIAAVVFYFAFDYKFRLSEKIFSYLKSHIKTAVRKVSVFAACAALLCIISSLTEYILGKFIIGPSSDGSTFNIYRCIFIFGILSAAAFLISKYRTAGSRFEESLFGIIIIVGMTMILITPVSHSSWDIDSHYPWALNASYIGDTYFTEADMAFKLDKEESFMSGSLAENRKRNELLNEEGNTVISVSKGRSGIAHFMGGYFIALARFIGMPFTAMYIFGKIPNLIIYAAVFYFAAKKLKSGKIILSIIALFPTNLLLATNYSYDYWVIAFGALGAAYYTSELQHPDKDVSLKSNIIMCSSLALAALPKLIYAPMLLIPFFMKKNDGVFKERKRYYKICLWSFAVLILLFLVRSSSSVTGTGDLRGGSGVNPAEQIKFIFTQPISYMSILIKFLLNYLSLNSTGLYMVNMAYLGMGVHAGIITVLLIAAILTDKSRYDTYASWWMSKTAVLVMYFGLSALIATALYISFTPVAHETVNGCQSRYITPLIAPAALLLANCRFSNIFEKINKTLYNYALIIPCTAVVFDNIYSTTLVKML